MLNTAISVYTDGSYNFKKRFGGWSVLVVAPGEPVHIENGIVPEDLLVSPPMEHSGICEAFAIMQAIKIAIKEGFHYFRIFSDCLDVRPRFLDLRRFKKEGRSFDELGSEKAEWLYSYTEWVFQTAKENDLHFEIIHVKAHTENDDQHSLGNRLADYYARCAAEQRRLNVRI